MNNIQNKLFALFFIALVCPQTSFSQDSLAFELQYEVDRVYPPVSITKEQLKEARCLIDINPYYDASWVREYVSVEILTSNKGGVKKAVSSNDILSQEQRDVINMAEIGTEILVNAQYIPDNNLTQNEVKEMNFTFTIDPESDAEFPGGEEELKQYLKENIADKVAHSSFRQYHLTAVKFAINEEGEVMDAHVFETSSDEAIDKLLVETINNMPNWKPAEYANGTRVKQEFVLTVGDRQSCVINLLNIRQEIE